jgi:S-adenosylmethionine-diacylglycerol 3-amino-3-carboxypropyl transferase
MTSDTSVSKREINQKKKKLLKAAVEIEKPVSKRAFLDRLFTFMFAGFVYPQIWEDPEVDVKGLKIDSGSRIMTIASGGCNVMNYLTEGPAKVCAIDLNPAHVSLTRLKIAAVQHLPDYESFFLFFGHANDKRNIENYDKYIAPNLDAFSRKYWEGQRAGFRGRRINYFTKNLYQFGLLGRTISFVHILAKIYGVDPREILTAKNMQEQKEIFDRTLGPLFEKKAVKWLCNLPVSLYGLGIPPAQFDELSRAAGGDMAALLKARLEKLACGFPIEDNYFAWQAFGRGYDKVNKKAIPRYLQPENYEKVKTCAERVEVHHTSITGFLQSQQPESFDCYVFLDAQDWMNARQLNELWSEVMRTASPGARVIFRTAADESPLPGALPKDMLGKWAYDEALCREMVATDRSSIYGGFHVYTLGGDVAAHKAKKAA